MSVKHLDILSIMLAKSSLHGGVKYSYRDLKLYGRAKKHPTGTSKNTIHRKGKREAEYKHLNHKHSVMRKIYDFKRNNMTFNYMPKYGECPMQYLMQEGYTEYEINNALSYFENLYNIKLKKTEHGYYTFRLFKSDKYVF